MPELTLTIDTPTTGSLEPLGGQQQVISHQDRLPQILAEIEGVVPPLWPLRDYVAVNPFLGMSQQTFLAARQELCEVRDCDLLPSLGYFRSLLQCGVLTRADIERALWQCADEYPDLYADFDVAMILRWVEGFEPPPASERRYYTVSETVDCWQGSSWTSHIVNDITRHCAGHFDEGQALWQSPWKHLPLFRAWREAAQLSQRMDMLGMRGFRRLVSRLPERPIDAIDLLLDELQIPASCWRGFLLCELFSVAGWASFIKYRVGEAAQIGRRDEDLLGLLAIRLAYDVALAQVQTQDTFSMFDLCPAADDSGDFLTARRLSPPRHVLLRYALQVAAETAYRRKLCSSLTARGTSLAGTRNARKTLQMVFCIDVRSEVMRRHLESTSEAIQTYGFAGFFGLPLEYVSLDGSQRAAQCPVLLRPSFRVRQNLLGASVAEQTRAARKQRLLRAGRTLWKSFQNSAVSCFSFVESLGLFYFGKLLSDSLGPRWPDSARAWAGGTRSIPSLGPDLDAPGDESLSGEQKIQFAAGMLRNLGLTSGFARIVAICGHAAEVVNNPYRASLDCGACGGHSGEPNARVAAALLNDRQVRAGLAAGGIQIPEDTWFVPAVHNTTTDEIRFFDTRDMPDTHRTDFAQVQTWVREAGVRTRLERRARFGEASAEDLLRRSRDWSEVRPEWGLAGNAAFIVAPRSRTAGLDLGGRTFLHNYEHARDPELKTLELIMTAPMIVTSWINLQYYASTVDNRSFGSGNKVLHNVIGQLGVVQGNGGDLMTGLPWQSVHDGEQFQHEPLRLLVVIEAPRHAVQQIVERHREVRELVSNGWVSLVALDNDRCYRWNDGRWHAEWTEPHESAAAAGSVQAHQPRRQEPRRQGVAR